MVAENESSYRLSVHLILTMDQVSLYELCLIVGKYA